MTSDNKDKSARGKNAQEAVRYILKCSKDQNLIVNYTENYRDGRDGYANNQFYSPFLAEFKDGQKWLIYSTTSHRDRVKSVHWDSYNLKEIDSDITKSYQVYPDSIDTKEKNLFAAYEKLINSGIIYSALDGVISQSEFTSLIEQMALEDKNSGQAKDFIGKRFEQNIVDILNNPENLDKMLNDSPIKTGVHFEIFEKIVCGLNIDNLKIKNIKATNDNKVLGYLDTGGNPKTDVLVAVTFDDNKHQNFTLSCKRTSAKSVSVHQYPFSAFANVLDYENKELRFLLKEFQKAGNLRDFGEKNINNLTIALSPYLKKLAMWVFGGIGGSGDPDIQWAHYLVTYKNESENIEVHTIEEYYNLLVENNIKGHFGTVFSWTYASKSKGKNIQLKTKIL